MRFHALALVTTLIFAPAYAAATDETAAEEAQAATSAEMPTEETSQPEMPAEPESEADAEPAIPTAPGSASTGSASTGSGMGTVARSAFTTDVVEREPVDRVDVLADDQGEVFFFTELKDLTGQTVVHRWEYDGKVMAEVPFEVKGPRWRVYSRKSLLPEWKGEWTVTVVDASGDPLDSSQFTYAPKTPPTPAPSPASPLADEEPTEAAPKTPPAAPED